MKIQVTELGAIKDAIIDLNKKLTVFCGPNGTGKTYLAYAIYALTKSTNIIPGFRPNDNFVKELISNNRAVIKLDLNQLCSFRQELVNNLEKETGELFGLSSENAKSYFSAYKISILENDEEFRDRIKGLEFDTNLKIGTVPILITKTKGNIELQLELTEKTLSKSDVEHMEFFLYSEILSMLSIFPITSSNFFPVERNSIYTFSKELSLRRNDAIDDFHARFSNKDINPVELFFKRTTRYPMPIRDGLQIAEDLARIKKTNSEYIGFAEQVENELLHGKIIINVEGEIQFKPEKAPKKQLPIHLTASIIKTLSSLVVYLKHIAQKNDLIIIDEPEINLHPDNQIILTRLFARLINNGFRLVISTHSDYIIREINNMIMLSSDKKEVIEFGRKYEYSEDERIDLNDVGVYYFNYSKKRGNNKQVSVEQVPVTESGFEIPSINDTIDRQNEIAEELFYTLKFGEKDE
jgi:predicted ATPase